MIGPGKAVDVRAVYAAVRERGGCDAVTAARGWPAVGTALGLQEGHPDVAAALRSGGAASSAAALKCAAPWRHVYEALCQAEQRHVRGTAL